MSKYSVFFNLLGVGVGSLAKLTFDAHSPHICSLYFAAQQPLAASNFEGIPVIKRLNFVSLKGLQLQKVLLPPATSSIGLAIPAPVDFLNMFMHSCD